MAAAARYDVEKGGERPPAPGAEERLYYPQREREREADREWVPWFVPLVVAVNVVLFAAAMYVNNCVARGFLRRFAFQPLSENPLLGPSSATLQKVGALVWDKVVQEHQGWRLVTCIWLHAGVLHLLANMLSLVLIGLWLEQQFGYVRIGIIYLVSGVGSEAACCRPCSSGTPSPSARLELWLASSEPCCHQLDHLLKQGCGPGDPPGGHRHQPRHRHPPARRQLRAHRGFSHRLPPGVRPPHAPALRLDAALRPALRRQEHLQEVPALPMGSAGRSFRPRCRRIRGWDGYAVQRSERE